MSDLCRDGGESAYDENIKSGKIRDYDHISDLFNTYYVEHSASEVEQRINEFCDTYQDTISFMDNVISTCSDLDYVYNHYNETKFYGNYYCNMVDADTGEKCYKIFENSNTEERYKYYDYYRIDFMSFSNPYSKWEPALCKSSTSCIAQLDTHLKEYYPNSRLFDGTTNNFVDCCGLDDGSKEFETNKCKYDPTPIENTINENNSTTDSDTAHNKITASSDATTLSAQITLLSLLICIIFALFK